MRGRGCLLLPKDLFKDKNYDEYSLGGSITWGLNYLKQRNWMKKKKKKDKNSKLFLCWRSHITALSSINLEISKACYSCVERWQLIGILLTSSMQIMQGKILITACYMCTRSKWASFWQWCKMDYVYASREGHDPAWATGLLPPTIYESPCRRQWDCTCTTVPCRRKAGFGERTIEEHAQHEGREKGKGLEPVRK